MCMCTGVQVPTEARGPEVIGSCEPPSGNTGSQALVPCKSSTGAFSRWAISPACIQLFPFGFLPFTHRHPHPPPRHHGRTFSLGSSVAAAHGHLALNKGSRPFPSLGVSFSPGTQSSQTFPTWAIHYLPSVFLQRFGFLSAITYITLFFFSFYLLPRL